MKVPVTGIITDEDILHELCKLRWRAMGKPGKFEVHIYGPSREHSGYEVLRLDPNDKPPGSG